MAVLLFKWLLWWPFLAAPVTPAKPVVHPFFVSVTEINHNATDKTLEISCKMFTDDLEKTLEKVLRKPVDLYHPDKVATGKAIFDYVKKHLSININGKPADLQFVGFEHEKEAVWSYFQVNNVPDLKKVIIQNNLLYDAFDKEVNLIHFIEKGNRQSTRLNYPDTQAEFTW